MNNEDNVQESRREYLRKLVVGFIAAVLAAMSLKSTLAETVISDGGVYVTPVTHTPSGGGTATLDLNDSSNHNITMPAGNITIAIANEQVGQKFLVRILQDGVGSRTVTWFDTIKWAGGSAPTLTATADKADTFVFTVTGTDAYDGFIVGQNI